MNEVIAAVGTAPGEGAIGIVRLSGEGCVDMVRKVFRPAKSPWTAESHRLSYGHIVDPKSGIIVDEVMVVPMRAPRSYTREDTVEIHCHGGTIPIQKVLGLILETGVRIAEPGEFTKRAFLNGRIDLSQAEAVIDIIRSQTAESMGVAVSQLQGLLSKRVSSVRQELLDLLVHVNAEIDYPEEDIPNLSGAEMMARALAARDGLRKLLDGAEEGRIRRDGIEAAIIGRPNVGKSSLLNALLEENRAIVTNIAGTTRDVIQETLNLGGIPFRMSDTAGIRVTEDAVERIGVERSQAVFGQADLVILVLDGSEPLTEDDVDLLEKSRRRPLIVVMNKTDLPPAWSMNEIAELGLGDHPVLAISTQTMYGLEDLKGLMVRAVTGGKVKPSSDILVTRVRHQDALRLALHAVEDALAGLESAVPEEFIAVDLQEAVERLGMVTGETVREEIIEEIFQQFCVGK